MSPLHFQAEKPAIPVVTVGVHRSTVVATSSIFAGTPFSQTAIMDLKESPEQYRYSAHNLGVVLHALHPRPQVLVTGTAVGELVDEVERVWDEYVEGVLKVEGVEKAAYVPLSDFHSSDGPPPPGTVEYLMDKLQETFG
ncbi:uncharacterized protein LTR77_008131 [Saxophila tyrrhenica]|uniref:Uncharacterized protein n=1 Tax=Saxophila tyrrhenica TaxID=1690608 RepID=A0AAV9P5A4_9PEZI|nr:hypothetical protein LTR77_008131 [Saxophila tyrrhenica]